MTKFEKLLLLLRLLKTHRDGLNLEELLVLLQCRPTAFYNYIKLLRKMSFNIICRKDGKYIIVLDEKTQQMLIDHFPDLLVKNERKRFKLKQGLELIYDKIYSVFEKKTGKIRFYREVPAICVDFPELEKFFIYEQWRGKKDVFETSLYRVQKGPLLGYYDREDGNPKYSLRTHTPGQNPRKNGW